MPSQTDVLSQFKKDDLLSVAAALGLDVAGSKESMVGTLGRLALPQLEPQTPPETPADR